MPTFSIFEPRRSSIRTLEEVYFWTDTIKDWKRLLGPDKYKELIIAQLKDLVDKKLIAVYGFVIMPNHLHLLWEMLAKWPGNALCKFQQSYWSPDHQRS